MNHPPSERTTVRRKAARARYAETDIAAIVDAALVAHIAFADATGVHSIPTVCWRQGGHLYVHGARNSRLTQALLTTPCALSIALVDGLVLARSAFHHSMNYRSVVVYGQFVEVLAADEQLAAYAALVDHVAPGRSSLVRAPDGSELAGTRLLRLPLAEAAAKVRNWGVEDRAEDLSWPVWAGVVPLQWVAGDPRAEPDCGPHAGPAIPDFLQAKSI